MLKNAKALVTGCAAFAFAIAAFLYTAPSAKAVTFNMLVQTVDPTNGYTITLNGLTTDVNNVAQSQISGNIAGYGTDSAWTGALSLITPSSTEGVALQGTAFYFDGKAFDTASYFSNSGSSGIVEALLLGSNTVYFNPYFGSPLYYDSVSLNGGYPSNPGDLVNVSASTTPLPAAVWMFGPGVGLLGFFATKRRKKQSGIGGLPALAAA